MQRDESAKHSPRYECRICGTTEEVVAEWEPELAICTDCWFSFLTGAEKRSIAERVDSEMKERRAVL